jgi:sugar phosphate permease
MSARVKSAWLGWAICGLGALYYAYEYLLRITPSVMEHALREHFSLSATGFGLLSAFYYYAYVPMQVPVGVLMDRFGPRRLLTFACGLCVLGTWMFAQTQMISVAAAGRFIVGFGSAFAFVGVLKLATLWLPEDKLGTVAGLASALGTLGAMAGDNFLGHFVHQVGWQAAVNYSAFFGIGLTFVLWFGIHDHKRHLEEDGGTINTFKDALIDLKIIVVNKQIWINGIYGCLVYLPTTVFAELWGIPYLHHAHHLSMGDAATANSFIFMGFLVGAPMMGWISDQLKRRKLPMFMGALCAAVVMMIVIYVPDLTLSSLNILMFTLGLFYSVQALVFAVGRELSPDEAAGTAVAMTNMLVMLGAMFIQPLIGRLLDWSYTQQHPVQLMADGVQETNLKLLYSAHDYQLAMSVIPIGIVIAAILTFFLRETHAHAKHNKS